MKTLLFMLGLALASAATAAPTLRKQLAGMPYEKARAKLVEQGWTARPGIDAATASGPSQWFVDHGFPEVESCTEGDVVCSFGFGNAAGECLHIVTHGVGARARVERLDRRCF